jgi:hypothetical protein
MNPRVLVPLLTFVLLCSLLISTVACQTEIEEAATSVPVAEMAPDVATTWFDFQLYLIQTTPGFTPPVAARALGYSGVTLYEAVVHGMPDHQSLAGQLNGLDSLPQPDPDLEYNWAVVAHSALASMTRRLFATTPTRNVDGIFVTEQRIYAQVTKGVAPDVVERSMTYGLLLAEAIYVWSLDDRGNAAVLTNYPAGYTPPSGPGMWVSTPPFYYNALQPYWGNNRPFALDNVADCDPGPPPEYSEHPDSQFYQEALEVYETVSNLTDEQGQIALFWADDPIVTMTPPGHWVSITGQVIEQYDLKLDVAAEAYARVGIAVADSFISCWYTKYRYNLVRPLSYIQNVIDSTWNNPRVTDPLVTPPFPEYTSGHSVQSAAAAYVLTDLLGDLPFVDDTHHARRYPARSYNSFTEAAEEAAISRLYGGIHFRTAIENGLAQGRCLGAEVARLQFRTTG